MNRPTKEWWKDRPAYDVYCHENLSMKGRKNKKSGRKPVK